MFLARHSAFTPQDLQKLMGHTVGFDTIFDRLFDMDLTRDSGIPHITFGKIAKIHILLRLPWRDSQKRILKLKLRMVL